MIRATAAALLVLALIAGCAKPDSNYWGSVARGVQKELQK